MKTHCDEFLNFTTTRTYIANHWLKTKNIIWKRSCNADRRIWKFQFPSICESEYDCNFFRIGIRIWTDHWRYRICCIMVFILMVEFVYGPVMAPTCCGERLEIDFGMMLSLFRTQIFRSRDGTVFEFWNGMMRCWIWFDDVTWLTLMVNLLRSWRFKPGQKWFWHWLLIVGKPKLVNLKLFKFENM